MAIFPETAQRPTSRPTSQANRNPTTPTQESTRPTYPVTMTKYHPTTAMIALPTITPTPVYLTPQYSITEAPKVPVTSLSPKSTTTAPQLTVTSKQTTGISPVQLFVTSSTSAVGPKPPGMIEKQQITSPLREAAKWTTEMTTARLSGPMTEAYPQRTTKPQRRTTISTQTLMTERPGQSSLVLIWD